MRHIMLLMLAGLLTFGLTSCKNKKESKDIITKMPTETKQLVGPLTMQAGTIPPRTVSWMGSNYRISITRQPDKGLPLVEDASGNKYYDNKVHLLITRADGSTFVDKTYTRADFSKYVDAGVAKKWGLTDSISTMSPTVSSPLPSPSVRPTRWPTTSLCPSPCLSTVRVVPQCRRRARTAMMRRSDGIRLVTA